MELYRVFYTKLRLTLAKMQRIRVFLSSKRTVIQFQMLFLYNQSILPPSNGIVLVRPISPFDHLISSIQSHLSRPLYPNSVYRSVDDIAGFCAPTAFKASISSRDVTRLLFLTVTITIVPFGVSFRKLVKRSSAVASLRISNVSCAFIWPNNQ